MTGASSDVRNPIDTTCTPYFSAGTICFPSVCSCALSPSMSAMAVTTAITSTPERSTDSLGLHAKSLMTFPFALYVATRRVPTVAEELRGAGYATAMYGKWHLTAATGMDALSHAVEGYLAKGNNPVADAIALDSIQRVFQWLPRAVANGSIT